VIDLMTWWTTSGSGSWGFPCVVRFQDLLRSRVKQLNEVFRAAIAQHGYKGKYFGVYPTKVNQMREVVRGDPRRRRAVSLRPGGGEQGRALDRARAQHGPEALTICNGYKDEEYLRLALMGRKLGRKIIVVVEKLSELPHLLRLAEENERAALDRVAQQALHQRHGKWESSSGDFAKFGSLRRTDPAVEILKSAGKLELAKLFHFHVGSQLTDIRTVKTW